MRKYSLTWTDGVLQLIPLPRTPTVSKILDDYAAATASTLKPSQISILKEVIAGLKLYFDKSLGNNLLYRFERGQYSEMKRRFSGLIPDETEEKREMCNVYGVEHLLRLFGRETLIAQLTGVTEMSISYLCVDSISQPA